MDAHATPRAKRHIRSLSILIRRVGYRKFINDRRWESRPDGGAADLPRGRQISLEQRWVDSERAGDIVEPIAGVVGRKKRGNIDIHVEQVADRVAVFDPVEPMQRLCSADIRMPGGGLVKLGLELHNQGVIGGSFGPR